MITNRHLISDLEIESATQTLRVFAVLALKVVVRSDLNHKIRHVVTDARDVVLNVEHDDLAALDGAVAIVGKAHCLLLRAVVD